VHRQGLWKPPYTNSCEQLRLQSRLSTIYPPVHGRFGVAPCSCSVATVVSQPDSLTRLECNKTGNRAYRLINTTELPACNPSTQHTDRDSRGAPLQRTAFLHLHPVTPHRKTDTSSLRDFRSLSSAACPRISRALMRPAVPTALRTSSSPFWFHLFTRCHSVSAPTHPHCNCPALQIVSL
jgi:hypothetical protein